MVVAMIHRGRVRHGHNGVATTTTTATRTYILLHQEATKHVCEDLSIGMRLGRSYTVEIKMYSGWLQGPKKSSEAARRSQHQHGVRMWHGVDTL
jgi:hypothetical protein